LFWDVENKRNPCKNLVFLVVFHQFPNTQNNLGVALKMVKRKFKRNPEIVLGDSEIVLKLFWAILKLF